MANTLTNFFWSTPAPNSVPPGVAQTAQQAGYGDSLFFKMLGAPTNALDGTPRSRRVAIENAPRDIWATMLNAGLQRAGALFAQTPYGQQVITGAQNQYLSNLTRSPWTWGIAILAIFGAVILFRMARR
jgi:hypothetical protein